MKAYLAIGLGIALLLAPLWTLSGFVRVPEYRTGTIADFQSAIVAGVTLYGGALAGILIGRLFRVRASGAGPLKATFMAGMAGIMGAITLALIVSFAVKLITTGILMPKGQSPALLPIFYVVGGILGAAISAGAGLIAWGILGASKANESK